MSLARTDTLDQRTAILRRLVRRNRVVAVLRILVPAFGVGAFALLAIQIYAASLARQYGISGIRIERGNVVVETPQYSGMGENGTRYVVNAREARTTLANSSLIDMSDATLDLTRAGGSRFHAAATEASFDTTKRVVSVPGTVVVSGDDGLEGTLSTVTMDMAGETTTADGPVEINMADGTRISAHSMVYDSRASLWTFADATVVAQGLPEAEEP